MKTRARHVQRICQLLLTLLLMAICNGCQPSYGFGAASAAAINTECSVDVHCGPNQYCYQYTGKCNLCGGEPLCKKYGRQLKSSITTHGCIKSVTDCGACLPNYKEDSDLCSPMTITDTYSHEGNKSQFAEKGDFADIINSPTVPWVGIIAAIIIVPVVVCLVYITHKSIRKRANREIPAGDSNESFPMIPLKPLEPQRGALMQTVSEVHQTNPPEEYLPPPPYAPQAPPIEVHTPPIEPRRELAVASNQQAVPFNSGLFGAQNQVVAENIVNHMQEDINDSGIEPEENQLSSANNLALVAIPELEEQIAEALEADSVHSEPTQPTAASTPTHNSSNFSADSGHGTPYVSLQLSLRLGRSVRFDPEASYVNFEDVMNPDASYTYQFHQEETSNESHEVSNDRSDRVVPNGGASVEEDEDLLMEDSEAPIVPQVPDNASDFDMSEGDIADYPSFDYWGED